MKILLLSLLAMAAVSLATPAAAQVWVEFDAGPVAARIGPPPPPWWYPRYWRPVYAYAPCRIIRERVRNKRGRWIYREREICW